MRTKEKKHLFNFIALCHKHLISYIIVSEDMELDNLLWENMSIEEIEEYILNNY